MSHLLRAVLFTTALVASFAALAQEWPTKPVKIIVPWAPGGSVDVLARIMAPHLSDSLKQPVIIENKAGASGNIGSDLVAKAAADGHTLLFGTNSTHVMNPALFANMPFKSIDDFTPVTMLTGVTNVVVAHPSLNVRNIRELLVLAKSKPGSIAYGSAGVGSQPHLTAELFKRMTSVDMLHVPYKGGAPANADLVAGQIQLMFTAYANVAGYVAAGKLNLLAVAESQRSPDLPSVPTVAETIPGFEINAYHGLFAPKGTPTAVRAKLDAESRRLLALPEVKARLSALGLVPVAMPGDEFEKVLRSDLAKWTRLITEIGVRLE